MANPITDVRELSRIAYGFMGSNLHDRIAFIHGDAVGAAWPNDQELVLMSYLLSAVAESSLSLLFVKPGMRCVLADAC